MPVRVILFSEFWRHLTPPWVIYYILRSLSRSTSPRRLLLTETHLPLSRKKNERKDFLFFFVLFLFFEPLEERKRKFSNMPKQKQNSTVTNKNNFQNNRKRATSEINTGSAKHVRWRVS